MMPKGLKICSREDMASIYKETCKESCVGRDGDRRTSEACGLHSPALE